RPSPTIVPRVRMPSRRLQRPLPAREVSTSAPHALSIIGRMQWDLYCRVVDNFGDIGVAWRLAADLAGRGESVRLAVDDASALAWMAPGGAAGVKVVGWQDGPSPAPDVVVELFGAGRPKAAWPAGATTPVLVNLEHLSAEPY